MLGISDGKNDIQRTFDLSRGFEHNLESVQFEEGVCEFICRKMPIILQYYMQ